MCSRVGINSLRASNGGLSHAFAEQQAMETLKNKLCEAENPETNILALLTDSFKTHDAEPSPSAFSFVIKYLFRKRSLSRIPPVLHHLESAERFEVPEGILANVIRAYGRAELLEDAADVFYRIPRFRCVPSARSLNTLLSFLCRKREGLGLVRDVLMKSLDMGIRLDASTFRILIGALCRNGKARYAKEMFYVMLQLDELAPDGGMYSMVLYYLCKQPGSSGEAMDFLKEMQNVGFSPKLSEYNSVIDALVRDGKANNAYSVLAHMRVEGGRPDITSYNSVLDGFVAANEFLKADRLFDEILLMGLVPDTCTYNTYIDGLCKEGNLERACRMVSCMEKAGCKPDSSTFNVLISGYSKAGDMGRAKEFMDEMLEKGFHWNSHTYESVISGLFQKGEIMAGRKLLVEMLGKGYVPQASTFNSCICCMCKNDHVHEAVQVLDEMTKHSISPDAMSWEALLAGCRLNPFSIPINLEAVTSMSLAA
ncbi:putative F-box protein [Iris pallida]|uniref:F-box protein n=1 Tax=Iris pallida TaxID=29817 RepID=A0AAX6FEQ5_IRIPA|nr:putative F-box protein [Iris pallida]